MLFWWNLYACKMYWAEEPFTSPTFFSSSRKTILMDKICDIDSSLNEPMKTLCVILFILVTQLIEHPHCQCNNRIHHIDMVYDYSNGCLFNMSKHHFFNFLLYIFHCFPEMLTEVYIWILCFLCTNFYIFLFYFVCELLRICINIWSTFVRLTQISMKLQQDNETYQRSWRQMCLLQGP